MQMQKYSIGSVSEMVGLPQSVLRYWESQFEVLSPEKTDGGTRRYSDKDVAIILRIKDFLYHRKYTIEGARKALMEKQVSSSRGQQEMVTFILSELKSILSDLEDLS
jgi:DNA-binding transcriptional MerR regulator